MPLGVALAVAAVLGTVGITIGFAVNQTTGWRVVGYLALTAVYSMFLKRAVMKDRQAILVTPRKPYLESMMERVRQHYYQKILVHTLSDGTYLYDLGWDRGIQRNLLQHYHEVRRIPGVRDLRVHYGSLMLGDIIVLEPQFTATALPGD